MSQIHHRFAKRMIDVAGGAFGLLVTSPILLISAAVLVWKVGWPVTFRQCRAGLKGKPFVIYKLKTMTDARDGNGDLEPDEKRLTTIGRVVRRFSLDELPQLWNVLKGEMSLVGPRPLRVEYLPLYSDFQRRRHDVRPGITGWAQIRGRNAITWQEKFTLDVWYVQNWSLILDLKIMLATLWPVLRGSGMSQAGHVTMPPFTGDESAAERPIVDLVQHPDQPLTNVVVRDGGLWSGRQDCLNS